MLFNSYEFVFLFLPATLAGFFLLGRTSRAWALGWLIVASLFFYAWWRPLNVLIIAPSILVNFALAHLLLRLRSDQARSRMARLVLAVGIVFNIAFLGYFKYVNFFSTVINDVAGTHFFLEQVILPLGISFITFQKIAFLIDIHARRIESFTLEDYCLFVLFFPQLIAGPIVHYREMMPQFHKASCRFDKENIAVGLTLFLMGLFKKVVLADGVAAHVSPIYDAVATGGDASLFPAWMAAIGFTLQMYFDFSGYTDMALGLARCFGVRLPPNFDSPLKASSIIDFWLRWHMTLTRFLTAYLYNPLVLWLTRRRLAAGKSVLGGRDARIGGAYFHLLAGPTVLTMFVSGLWHGAGYVFILWGLLHGLYLSINHAWRIVGPRLWADKASYNRFMRPVGLALTFPAVAISMILFRSPTVGAASELLQGMLGFNGITLPQQLFERLGPFTAVLKPIVSASVTSAGSGAEFVATITWIVALLVIALAFPNSLQILSRHEPAIGVKSPAEDLGRWGWALDWRPTLPWAFLMSALAVTSIIKLGGKSEFLYWQF
jgi:D-alanyl-lipoteichoic acid acyltransferase DltB (MBOAT superfamily)